MIAKYLRCTINGVRSQSLRWQKKKRKKNPTFGLKLLFSYRLKFLHLLWTLVEGKTGHETNWQVKYTSKDHKWWLISSLLPYPNDLSLLPFHQHCWHEQKQNQTNNENFILFLFFFFNECNIFLSHINFGQHVKRLQTVAKKSLNMLNKSSSKVAIKQIHFFQDNSIISLPSTEGSNQ